jgi:hypothetical protein
MQNPSLSFLHHFQKKRKKAPRLRFGGTELWFFLERGGKKKHHSILISGKGEEKKNRCLMQNKRQPLSQPPAN